MTYFDDVLVKKANQRFVTKAMKAPLLSFDLEKKATKKWKNKKDIKSLHLIINSYEKLVISTAIKFRKYGLPFGDLVQEGNIGILKAAYKFDPNIKVRFSTYAIWWIKSCIQEFVLRNWSIVKIGSTSTQKLLFFQLSRVQNKIKNAALIYDDNFSVSKNLAKELGVKISDIEKISERILKKDLQLDQKIREEDNRNPMEFLQDQSILPDDVVINKDIQENRRNILNQSLDALNNKERHIIKKRHLGYNKETLESIGKQLGISKERVRQLESRALLKLKKRILIKNSKNDLI